MPKAVDDFSNSKFLTELTDFTYLNSHEMANTAGSISAIIGNFLGLATPDLGGNASLGNHSGDRNSGCGGHVGSCHMNTGVSATPKDSISFGDIAEFGADFIPIWGSVTAVINDYYSENYINMFGNIAGAVGEGILETLSVGAATPFIMSIKGVKHADEVIDGIEAIGKNSPKSTTSVGQWMSEAEYSKFVKDGGIPRTNVLTNGPEGYIKQTTKGDYYATFDVDSSLLKVKDKQLGWSLITLKNQMYIKLAEKKGITLAEPIGTNIQHNATKFRN